MKILLAIATMLSFNLAFAKEYVNYGHIHFQSASTWVKAQNVCQEGGFLFHKKKPAVAVEYCDDRGSNCEVVYKGLKQPMKSTRTICKQYSGDNGPCKEYVTVSYNQGTTTAKVYRTQHDMEEDRRPVRTFKYTVDSCNM